MLRRSLLITGATGKQGGALIQALLNKPDHTFDIYAVTRDAQSARARAIAQHPHVRVIEGNFDKPEAILAQVPNIWGLFLMSTPIFGTRNAAANEERQGKDCSRAAIKAGVKHIVFTSVDRGADADHQATPIPHFESKRHIEEEIRQLAQGTHTTWTFLRPAAFMDNVTPDFLGKGFVAMWRQNGADSKLKLIGSQDVGRIAAHALENYDGTEYRNQSISLASDEITPSEAAAAFKDVTNQDLPNTFSIVGSALKWMMKDELGRMFAWFKSDGFGADVPSLRQRYPFLKSFRQWVEEESAWKKT